MSSTGLVTFAYPSTDGGATVDNGGSIITSYTVNVKEGDNLVQAYVVSDLSSLALRLEDLTAGTAYTVEVVATNGVGSSTTPATYSYTPSGALVSSCRLQ